MTHPHPDLPLRGKGFCFLGADNSCERCRMTVTRKTFVVLALVAVADASYAQDAKRGEKVFEECRACHAADGVGNEVGPGLRGVFGRKAGEREDFRYSPAMK